MVFVYGWNYDVMNFNTIHLHLHLLMSCCFCSGLSVSGVTQKIPGEFLRIYLETIDLGRRNIPVDFTGDPVSEFAFTVSCCEVVVCTCSVVSHCKKSHCYNACITVGWPCNVVWDNMTSTVLVSVVLEVCTI